MATKQTFRFHLSISGTVKATTLEEAEKQLDHAFNTEALRKRGVVIEGRSTGVDRKQP